MTSYKASWLKRLGFLSYLLCLLLLSLFVASAHASPDSDLRLYVFSNSECPSCVERLRLLPQEGQIILYELKESDNRERFSRIADVLEEAFLPVPLVGVFEDNNLVAVAGGGLSREAWESVINGNYGGVPIYVSDVEGDADRVEPTKIIVDQEKIGLLTGLFTKLDVEDEATRFVRNVLSLLPIVAAAAAVDAINPCEFNVFAILLTLVLLGPGRKALLKMGFAFTLAIFITYFSMGLGLTKVFAYLPQMRYVIVLFTLVMGVLEIVEFLGRELKRVPDIFARRISSRLEQALNPTTAFIAGAVTGLLLLPCTSGPYFIVLNILSQRATLFEGLLLLVVYNAIIVTPFLIITSGVYALTLTTMGMKLWLSEKRRWMKLLAGVMMILLSLYLLL